MIWEKEKFCESSVVDSLHMNVFKENTAHHSRDDKIIIKTLAKRRFCFYTKYIYVPQYYRAACDLM